MPIAGADSTRKGSQLQEKTPLGNNKPRLVDRHSSGQVGRTERSDNLRGLKERCTENMFRQKKMNRQKEEFLKITTYEEFDKRREEFDNLPFDDETMSHLDKLFGKGFAPTDYHHDLFR